MRNQPLTLLRGLLLVILVVGASTSARAHDWPFHVDASERFITSVRMQPEPHAAQRASFASKLLRDLQIPPLTHVKRSTVRKGLRFANYMTVPQFFQFEIAHTQQLVVSVPVNTAAPMPQPLPTQAVVYAEHCLGEEYLPYDFCTEDALLVAGHSITQRQRDQVSSGIENMLASASQWHCEIIDQLHSARLATDVGQAIGSLSSQLVEYSHAAAKGLATKLSPYNARSLPKYVYLKTRSGTVLAPAHLAQRWETYETASAPEAMVHLFVESGNELRSVVSQRLQNVAESLDTLARLLAPASSERVATKHAAKNR